MDTEPHSPERTISHRTNQQVSRNKDDTTIYQNIQNTVKTSKIRYFVAINAYIKKSERHKNQ